MTVLVVENTAPADTAVLADMAAADKLDWDHTDSLDLDRPDT